MDKPISVGDTVVVVRPKKCCGRCSTYGHIFVVANFWQGQCSPCSDCGEEIHATLARASGEHDGWEISRLKRIPPPEELGIVDEKEELHA